MSKGEPRVLDEAIRSLNSEAERGNAHAESTLAFLYASGYGVQQSDAKAFLFHHFAAHKGNLQSKMALAYSYSRQQVSDLCCITSISNILSSYHRTELLESV